MSRLDILLGQHHYYSRDHHPGRQTFTYKHLPAISHLSRPTSSTHHPPQSAPQPTTPQLQQPPPKPTTPINPIHHHASQHHSNPPNPHPHDLSSLLNHHPHNPPPTPDTNFLPKNYISQRPFSPYHRPDRGRSDLRSMFSVRGVFPLRVLWFVAAGLGYSSWAAGRGYGWREGGGRRGG